MGRVVDVFILQQLRRKDRTSKTQNRTEQIETSENFSKHKEGDVSDPAEDDGSAVQDAALWLHLQATTVVTVQKLSPVHL